MGRLPYIPGLPLVWAGISCLCVVVLKLSSALGLLPASTHHHFFRASPCQHHFAFHLFQYITYSLSSAKPTFIAPSHQTINRPEPSTSASRLNIPTHNFRTCLPPPRNLPRALRLLSPRRKSLSAPLQPTRRKPKKMTTTRTQIPMIPKGKELAPRAKNTMLLENHIPLQRNMPKTQAASRNLMEASAHS